MRKYGSGNDISFSQIKANKVKSNNSKQSLKKYTWKNKEIGQMGKALTKKCSMCSIEKRLNEFYENSTKADHRNGICKDCQKEVNQKNK